MNAAAAKKSMRIGLYLDAYLHYVALSDIKGQRSATANGLALQSKRKVDQELGKH